MLGVATLGFKAGLDRNTIFSDLRNRADEGSRLVPDREIEDTLTNATTCPSKIASKGAKRVSFPILNGSEARSRILSTRQGARFEDLINPPANAGRECFDRLQS
jgi:hypothetical protein